MLAFQIFINGRKVSLAGAEDLVVLHSIISAVGKLGKKTSDPRHSKGYRLSLYVGGLTGRNEGINAENLQWIMPKKLKVGDRVEIRVCKSTTADAPIETTPVDVEKQERLHYKGVKMAYMKLRKKFEKKRVKPLKKTR
jgi:hypothetical protein